MKSPILILFIILNLLVVNLASATSMHVEESSESHLTHAQDDAKLAGDIAEVDCDDHSCHLSTHMIGLIQYVAPLSFSGASIGFTSIDESLKYLNLDPPFEPPKA